MNKAIKNYKDNNKNKKEFKLLDPKNDVVFQMLFLKDNLAKGLLENILSDNITSLRVDVNKQLFGNTPEDKIGIVDLRAVINEEIECEIEMQMFYFKNFIPRFLDYWSKLYSGQLKKGDNYGLLHKAVSIAIINQNIPNLKELQAHTIWHIREDGNHRKILTNNLELHIIEVQKVKKEYKSNKDDKLLQWIMFLLNPESEEVDNIMVRNKKIEEAKKELLSLSQDEGNQRIADFRERELRDKIDMYETGKDIGKAEGIKVGKAEGIKVGKAEGIKVGKAEGIKVGKAEGIKEGKVEVIINLLKMKMPIDKIIEATKIPKEEIDKIKRCKNL